MGQESGDDLPGSHMAATGSQSVGCISVRILDPLTSSESCQQNLVPCSCRTEGPTLFLSPGCCSAIPCMWPLSGPLTTWGLPTSRPAKDSLSPLKYSHRGDIHHLCHSLLARSQSRYHLHLKGERIIQGFDSLGLL